MTKALTMATHNNEYNNNNNNPLSRPKFGQLLRAPVEDYSEDNNNNNNRYSNASELSSATTGSSSSPRLSFYYNDDVSYTPSNWSQASPYIKSPWIKLSPLPHPTNTPNNNNNIYYSRGRNFLIGSLLREEGHVYSLAVKSGVLYTGSESKNIRVWRNFHDSGGFKSGSGLVKAIVISRDYRVFTGHQDGKIRIWSEKGKRVGTLPKLSDYLKNSMNPKNYVEVRRHHKVPKIKHFDAVSCLSLNEESGLLYSGSWDKTLKVWRLFDGKCLETIEAHDDAINSIVVGFNGLVFSGSADGSVKVWRRELVGKKTNHFHVETLLKQDNAVTALAAAEDGGGGGGGGGGGFVLYGGSSDGLVNFWEREKEELCYGGVLRGHKLAVLCMAAAGCLVFSGSADKSICVWKREGGGVHSCLAVLSGHSGPVKCLAVEEDHDRDDDHDQDCDEESDNQRRSWIVYSGSLDKSIKIWRVSEQ